MKKRINRLNDNKELKKKETSRKENTTERVVEKLKR
jgi:hypothetical protein